MKFLDKFGLSPKSFDIDGKPVYCKSISYNLAIAIANEPNDVVRQLLIIRHCLCEEDGSPCFQPDINLEEIGDILAFEYISQIATKIAKLSGPKERDENIKKKQGS